MIPTVGSDFLGSMITEFPYLFDREDVFSGTKPLEPRTEWPNTPPSRVPSVKVEFPPSPPQSDGRGSVEEYSRAVLEELASESESMRSVVDAINKASSERSSFDSPSENDEYDDGYFYATEDQHSNYQHWDYQSEYPSEYHQLWDENDPWDDERPTTQSSQKSFESETASTWNSPILNHRKSTFPQLPYRSDSLISNTTLFDSSETSISVVLAERRLTKPNLTPLIITPVPGQYGPPLRRRQHLKGSHPTKPRLGQGKVSSTLVKVVEEEVVEYTPVEGKGWIRQRRVSRGGDWIVLEREILNEGAI